VRYKDSANLLQTKLLKKLKESLNLGKTGLV